MKKVILPTAVTSRACGNLYDLAAFSTLCDRSLLCCCKDAKSCVLSAPRGSARGTFHGCGSCGLIHKKNITQLPYVCILVRRCGYTRTCGYTLDARWRVGGWSCSIMEWTGWGSGFQPVMNWRRSGRSTCKVLTGSLFFRGLAPLPQADSFHTA